MDFSLDRTIAILDRTPRVLDAQLRGLDPAWTHANYGPGTWSAYNVVGHLIIGERDDWIPRARRILEHGTARPFDPFPHDATIQPSSGSTLNALLDEFASVRAVNLKILRSMDLTPPRLALKGTHPALGEVTLAQLLATWAVHDLHHIRQVERAMAHQARALVGPWRAYINTLSVDG
jgi:uncharacterized damage-inducible protein DinB